jgi:hypothetical protein
MELVAEYCSNDASRAVLESALRAALADARRMALPDPDQATQTYTQSQLDLLIKMHRDAAREEALEEAADWATENYYHGISTSEIADGVRALKGPR